MKKLVLKCILFLVLIILSVCLFEKVYALGVRDGFIKAFELMNTILRASIDKDTSKNQKEKT